MPFGGVNPISVMQEEAQPKDGIGKQYTHSLSNNEDVNGHHKWKADLQQTGECTGVLEQTCLVFYLPKA